MERFPDKADNQKRRKKSQEENNFDEMEEEIELFQLVEKDLRLKATVGWQNAVQSLNAAFAHIERNESQLFLDYCFGKIISIMLDQHASKIGQLEKNCVVQCLTLSIPIILAQIKTGKFKFLTVLVMVFNKKKTFYKDLRTSAMIGSYWNKVSGSPEVRSQCIAAFCNAKGFHTLLETLEKMHKSDALSCIDSEDMRILLQAMMEHSNAIPKTICTRISVLVLTVFTKISDATLKKESSDAIGAVIGIIRRLVDADVVPADVINDLWLEFTQRYLESSSLPLRLFGLEQLHQIIHCARASRAFPGRYCVRNAGTSVVNGTYELQNESSHASYVMKREDTGQVFTLFRCAVKSGMKWWFISEADEKEPGSSQDIDYYQHASQQDEFLPPSHNWTPIGKGVGPPPDIVAVEDSPDDVEYIAKRRNRLDYKLGVWVTEKKILQEVFGDRIHRETVSRSALLVKFLVECDQLDRQSLDIIWKSCIQKDQTLVDEIHNLIVSTVPFLSASLMIHLLDTLRASLSEKLDRNEEFPELLAFLERLASTFATYVIGRCAQVTTSILQLLWSLQVCYDVRSMRLSRTLRDFFQEALQSEFGEPLRRLFLSECVEGIKQSCGFVDKDIVMVACSPRSFVKSESGAEIANRGDSASKSLELLRFLIDSYKMDQARVIEALNQDHGLVALLFDELAAFVSRSVDRISATYRTAIGHRLELIHYIHVKSPSLELHVQHIEKLWDVLSSSAVERELCLMFFHQAGMRTHGMSPAFNMEVCRFVFEELLCKQTDYRTLGSMGYKCFHTYFVNLNSHQQIQARGGGKSSPMTTSRDNDTVGGVKTLLGLDALWEIAFHSPTSVSQQATRELLTVYDNLMQEEPTGSAASSVGECVNDFLQRIFQKLSQVSGDSNDSIRLVQHCTSLLSGLTAQSRLEAPLSHAFSGRGTGITLKVVVQRLPVSGATTTGGWAPSMSAPNVGGFVSAGNASPTVKESSSSSLTHLTLRVYAHQSLRLLRTELEKILHHPMDQTKLLLGGVLISGDKKTLSEFTISDNTEIRALLFNSPTQQQRNGAKAQSTNSMDLVRANQNHPGQLLASNAEYFEILFRVLDILSTRAASVTQLLWNFLARIPTNVHLLEQVLTLDPQGSAGGDHQDASWACLLQNVTYHKAVYTLQIIYSLLIPSDLAPNADECKGFLSRFVQGGGFRQVLSFFLGDLSTNDLEFCNEGNAVALRIIKYCMFDCTLCADSVSPSKSLSENFESLVWQDTDKEHRDVRTIEKSANTLSLDGISTVSSMVELDDYNRLVTTIGELIVSELGLSQTRSPEVSPSGSQILVDAIKTVESIVLICKCSGERFVRSNRMDEVMVRLLLRNSNDQVRSHWCSLMECVCLATSEASDVVFDQVIDSINHIEQVGVDSSEYFRLLRFLARLSQWESTTKCKALALAVLGKIRGSFSIKFLASNEHVTEILVGFLEFLKQVIGSHPAIRQEIALELMEVVYDDCLFTLPSENGNKRCPLCVCQETRRPAFQLLAKAILTRGEVLQELCKRLFRLFHKNAIALHGKWMQDTAMETRGIGEFVGLKNQGCSCYMNSFLQQLFMHPIMRQGLLEAKVSKRPKSNQPSRAEVEEYPARLVGNRVAMECVDGRSYEAQVVGYDEVSGCHTIRYDEGGEACFVLSEGRQGTENGRYTIVTEELSGQEATLEVLRQVQRTFCYLRDSEMRYFNPKLLVDACKCLNLEFSVYQQNDASEFCDKLLDRLETGLKATPQGPKCLQYALDGKLIMQKLPKDCGHRYEREEAFIRLELQIRGKDSVEASLAGFVEGEVMDGDNKVECELCGTKKAAVRRTCFGHLPNLLILHLKRFDLDYTTFETVKLNNRCAFPMTLNMKPYTKEGLEEEERKRARKPSSSLDESEESSMQVDESPVSTPRSKATADRNNGANSDGEAIGEEAFEYRLTGILVHSGVAQGGHYYSFIFDQVSEKWFKYDDEEVTPFDPAQIEAECFGGVQRRSWHGSSSNQADGPGNANNGMEMEVFSNALMLFYDKIKKNPPPNDSADGSAMEIDPKSPTSYCEYEKEVWQANELFLQNSYVFDHEFHDFLREMVAASAWHATPSKNSVVEHGSALGVRKTLTSVGMEFLLGVLIHSREKHGITHWIEVLVDKFAEEVLLCEWFFEQLASEKRTKWTHALLFECPDASSRQSFVQLVIRALRSYERWITRDDTDRDSIARAHEVYRRFVDVLIGFLDGTPVQNQCFLEELFALISGLASTSVFLRKYMQRQDVVARCVTFFLHDRAPAFLKKAFGSPNSVGSSAVMNRYTSCDYLCVLDAIVSIVGIPKRTPVPILAVAAHTDQPSGENRDQAPEEQVEEDEDEAFWGSATQETSSTNKQDKFSLSTVLSDQATAALTLVFKEGCMNRNRPSEQSWNRQMLEDYFLKCSRFTMPASINTNTNSNSNVNVRVLVAQKIDFMLTKYGDVGTGRIELPGFLGYYEEIARNAPDKALSDLKAMGFGEDLQRASVRNDLLWGELGELSRLALSNSTFFEAALEENAESCLELLLSVALLNCEFATRFVNCLLWCMQHNLMENRYKSQIIWQTCARGLEQMVAYDWEFQAQLIEKTFVDEQFGLLTICRQPKSGGKHTPKVTLPPVVGSQHGHNHGVLSVVNTNVHPIVIYRQIVLLLQLYQHVPAVQQWLDAHLDEWKWMYEWLRIESVKSSLGGRLGALYRDPIKKDTLLQLGRVLNIEFEEESRSFEVCNAGLEVINGVYKSTGSLHDACCIYVCKKDNKDYTLFRCRMPSKARRWYLSLPKDRSTLGTASDEDFYYAVGHYEEDMPPEFGWKVWTKNTNTKAPAPSVRMHSSSVDNVLVSMQEEEEEDDDDDDDNEEDSAFPEDVDVDVDLDDGDGDVDADDEGENDGDGDGDGDADVDADADTVEYDDSEDEIRISNERFQAVHLDSQHHPQVHDPSSLRADLT